MKTCIIIPTYNESRTIAVIIKQLKEEGHNIEILVVDDGSCDNTHKIAKEYGATVLVNHKNQGKGASLIRGFDYALRGDFEAVITMDGDGQHHPKDISYFIRLAKCSNSGILIGNRMAKTKNMPVIRFITNKFMSWVISKAAGQHIPDTQCGFRLIKKDTLKKLNLRTSRYEIESEMLIKAARLGLQIESVPIKTIYAGEKSQINPFVDTIRFIKFITYELWTTRP